jgi:hypothetical protein
MISVETSVHMLALQEFRRSNLFYDADTKKIITGA